MQYQLEHHLFPTLPRYKYRHLVPLVKKFAEENGLEYKSTGSWDIIRDNIMQVRCASVCVSVGCFLVWDMYCRDIEIAFMRFAARVR
ncbi:unnamed protein product [Ectocarpus fasciculatus]